MTQEINKCGCRGEGVLIPKTYSNKLHHMKCSKCHTRTHGTVFKNDEYNIMEWNKANPTHNDIIDKVVTIIKNRLKVVNKINISAQKSSRMEWLTCKQAGLLNDLIEQIKNLKE